jgi:hypothetical protein
MSNHYRKKQSFAEKLRDRGLGKDLEPNTAHRPHSPVHEDDDWLIRC